MCLQQRELDIVPSSPIGNPKIHLTVIYRHDYFSGRWRQVSRKFSNEEHVRQGLDEVVVSVYKPWRRF